MKEKQRADLLCHMGKMQTVSGEQKHWMWNVQLQFISCKLVKETLQSSNWALRRFGRNWALEKGRVPYTSYRMQVDSAPWHKWAIRSKLSVPPTAFWLQSQRNLHRVGPKWQKIWWFPPLVEASLFPFPSHAGLETFSPLSIFIIWRQSGLGTDLERQTLLTKHLCFYYCLLIPWDTCFQGQILKPSPQLWSGDIWPVGYKMGIVLSSKY